MDRINKDSDSDSECHGRCQATIRNCGLHLSLIPSLNERCALTQQYVVEATEDDQPAELISLLNVRLHFFS